MVLDQECHRQEVRKSSQDVDKKEEKNFLPNGLNILKKRSDFLTIRKLGKVIHGSHFIVNYLFSKEDKLAFGFTVSKKIGNAVTRNYIKRVLRHIIRKNFNLIPQKYKFEIIPKKNIEKKKFNDLETDLLKILKNLVI